MPRKYAPRFTEQRLAEAVEVVREHGPMTTDRVEARLGLSYSSTGTILRAAEARGLLKSRLAPELRKGPSGRFPKLWAVTE